MVVVLGFAGGAKGADDVFAAGVVKRVHLAVPGLH